MKDIREREQLFELCETVRGLSTWENIEQCKKMVREAMGKYPDAAQPHNLYGILLEKKGDHAGAMRHFRAAWALDPTYAPARQNLDRFGSFSAVKRPAYDEKDCQEEQKPSRYKVEYDENGVGHVVRRWKHEMV